MLVQARKVGRGQGAARWDIIEWYETELPGVWTPDLQLLQELDTAKDLYDEMISKGLKAKAECFLTLVHFLCQGKDFDFEGALRICDDRISSGWFPNVMTMSTLVRGLASTNKLDEARRITRLLKKRFRTNAEIWEQIEMELLNETEISPTA